MPAPIRRLRMSPDAYHLLPFHPGWKIEYIHGEAVFQPREAFAYGALPVRPPTSHAPAGVAVHPLDSADATALIELFHDAFSETPEYAGWSDETFAKEPRRVVHDFLAGKRGAISPASRVAVRDGALVGAAFLVAHDAGAALLDVLMIAPAAQRRGIATALATAALAHLAATGGGRLISRWHLANEASVAWHRRQGFIEEPDFFNAQLYLRSATQELWRLEKLSGLTASRREDLLRIQEHWQREVARLEARLDAGDRAAAFASYRFERARRGRS